MKAVADQEDKEELVATDDELAANKKEILADERNEELNPQPEITTAPGKRLKLRLSAPAP
jgi:hypothetical protein